ncbi:MAG: aldo/keto reductase [Rhizobiales bacterium]|nr:aldo/keto reductase [Hyphomicrobiales bacterium]NRB15306.1 aldo/keto reductase [Hyphomicrobiales bacterium]
MQKIKLWNGKQVPRVGMGCWAIGGTTNNEGPSASYGDVNEADARAGLNHAYEMGARLFDTAASYGAGRSESFVGDEISKHEDAVIVTKFGYPVDDVKRLVSAEDVSPAAIEKVIDGSRRRLKRDKLDLVLLHLNNYPTEKAKPVFDCLDELVAKGKIEAYGWSSDGAEGLADYVERPHFVAFENDLNLFTPATEVMKLAAENNILSISRLPLAMGLLTGKYRPKDRVAANDVRAQGFDWVRFFKDGQPSEEYIQKMDMLRDLLCVDGRTLAQGALSWILAYSANALPVPGFKTMAQAEENFATATFDLYSSTTMLDIGAMLASFDYQE